MSCCTRVVSLPQRTIITFARGRVESFQRTYPNFNKLAPWGMLNVTIMTQLHKHPRQQLQRDKKKANLHNKSQQIKLLHDLKPTNFTMQRTKLKHKRQKKLKHKELNSKAWRYWSHDDVPITSQGNQQINNIPTLKPIVEGKGSFNRHRDKRVLNFNYQRIKPPIKAIGKTFKGENANVLCWLRSSRFQDGGPATYSQQNSTRIHRTTHAQNLNS